VIWLVAMWIAVIALWGMIEPGMSADTMTRLVCWLRARRRTNVEHPFDWAKE
jgi:hypothetical protein